MTARVFATWILLLCFATPSLGEESKPSCRYYVLIFGAQKPVNLPRYAHTFACFVKETIEAEKSQLEHLSISWVGAEKFRLFGGHQPGRNLSTLATLDRCVRRDQRISLWGPVEITEELYRRAAARVSELESGRCGWQALDMRSRESGTAMNCFHAVSDLVLEKGKMRCFLSCGDSASEKVYQHLSCHFICPTVLHYDLIPRLGFDRYCVRRMNCR